MTTTYRQVERTVLKQEFVSCTCDWCGAQLEEDYGNHGYDRRNFDLKFTTGQAYPDSSYGEGWRVEDLCDDCIEKLRAALVALGIKVAKYEYDY